MQFTYLSAAAVLIAAAHANPCLSVPACPDAGTIKYDKSVPEKTAFPLTQVDLCYTFSALHINFTAYNETNFYYNASQGTNDEIYNYEVMEAFIYQGTEDPQTYLEFEVNPNNITYNAFVYNPSKNRSAGAPFDDILIPEALTDGLTAKTKLNKARQKWKSDVSIPLGLFNVDNGTAKGTEWRMNFFRTVVSPESFPNQTLGAWNPPNEASFHITSFFGNVTFI